MIPAARRGFERGFAVGGDEDDGHVAVDALPEKAAEIDAVEVR